MCPNWCYFDFPNSQIVYFSTGWSSDWFHLICLRLHHSRNEWFFSTCVPSSWFSLHPFPLWPDFVNWGDQSCMKWLKQETENISHYKMSLHTWQWPAMSQRPYTSPPPHTHTHFYLGASKIFSVSWGNRPHVCWVLSISPLQKRI